MSNDNDEIMRRFQALRGVQQHVPSDITASSIPVLTHEQQQRSLSQPIQQRLPLSQLEQQQQQRRLPFSQPEQRNQQQQQHQKEQQQQQQQQKQQKPKKKTSRGNRKLQRFRTKLRKRGLSHETIATLINNYNTSEQGNNDEQSTVSNMDVEQLISTRNHVENENIQRTTTTTKRKREIRPTTGVTTSMSQMSLSHLPTKRQRSTTTRNNVTSKKKTDNNPTVSDNKPKYLKVPDQIFKDMLSKALVGEQNIIELLLDTPEKLQFVRTYTHLLNNVFYLKLEQNFWEHYNTVCMSEDIWSVPMIKDMAKQNNLCRFKFKTKIQLERHYTLIVKRLREAENKLDQHKQQPMNRSFNMNKLSAILTAFVQQGQHKLSKEFERKKLILQYDANDHRLVKAFYHLKPTENQIRSAKIIWQAVKDKLQAEEDVAILKQRIYAKRLPSSFSILDHSIDPMENMLKQPAINQDKRAALSFRRLKTIAQFKYDMMVLTISTAEETIRSHTNIIANEKKKLIESANGQIPIPKSLIELMNAIAARQSNMVQRSQLILQQKLSVFDDAPMGFFNNCTSSSNQQAKEFFTDVNNLLRRLYTTPLSPKLFTRAQYEYRLVKSTRRKIKKSNVIIRPTDKSKVLHLGSATDYQKKALQYMHETNAYREITSGINPCDEHLQKVLAVIDPMLKNGEINLKLWKQSMRPHINTTELAYLYTIPKPHKIGTPPRPIVSSIKAAATGVSHFLDLLLRPIFDRVAKETTYINGIEFVRHMESYRDSGRLLPTTLFVTFDVSNLYTMIPRDGAILALQKFLAKHAENRRIHGMTIDTITKLARLVLDTNSFLFENKYYQQIRGGAMGSPFTMTLANIYMLEWEQPLVEYQNIHNQLYGRYIDDVFMTTNLSFDQIKSQLDTANNRDHNIKISYSIGSTVEFLDVLVENKVGQLRTTVFHKPAAEPYILPFTSDHPRHIHRSTVKSQLVRATRLCSHVEDFDQERLNIEFTLLLNGYPPNFISYHFKQLFQKNNVMSLMEQLDEDVYRELHRQSLMQPTRREKQKQSIALDDHPQQNNNPRNIRVYFTFESGPMLKFPQELKKLWKKHYIDKNSTMKNVHLKIGTRSNKNLNQLFIKKKPPKAMLAP
ncbi:unnamed protein product, partial [Adineta steineri]